MGKKKKKREISNTLSFKNTETSTDTRHAEHSEPHIGRYETELKDSIEGMIHSIGDQENRINSVLGSLNIEHDFYKKMVDCSNITINQIYPEIGNNPCIDTIDDSAFVLFDFENNLYFDNKRKTMPECYVSENNAVSLCSNKGIYAGAIYSSANLFMSNKDKVAADSNYLQSFEDILKSIISKYELNSPFSYFCMLPETVDIFNTKVRRCLNTSKGKVISIPKSIALAYYYLDNLPVGEKFCVVNLDGISPIVTQLSISMDEKGNKQLQREGIFQNINFSFSTSQFAKTYLDLYTEKYIIKMTKSEIDRVIHNKQLLPVFGSFDTLRIFRSNEIVSIFRDDEVLLESIKKCHPDYKKISNKYKTMIVSSSLIQRTEEVQGFFANDVEAFEGLKKIRTLLCENKNTIVWVEILPKISLEVIDDKTGMFKSIDLIDKIQGQKINLSLDEEFEVSSPGTITLQKGKKEYYLPLQREISYEDINSDKEAYFFHESFPLHEDLSVELVVKYNYLSESPLTIYARPKTKHPKIKEIGNKWVDTHEIQAYEGPTYNSHRKENQTYIRGRAFLEVAANLKRFIDGNVSLSGNKFYTNIAMEVYHWDLKPIEAMYRFVRLFFDSTLAESTYFRNEYAAMSMDFFFQQVLLAMNFEGNMKAQSPYLENGYSEKTVATYKKGLNRLLSDIIVCSWYYKKQDKTINQIYSTLANGSQVKVLMRLTRCIQSKDDDIYHVFEKMTHKLSEYFSATQKSGYSMSKDTSEYLRTLSSNCWFNSNWVYLFYETTRGPEVVDHLLSIIKNYLQSSDYGYDKKYRDIMEFLVCITRLKNANKDLLNPNKKETKELLALVKKSYDKASRSLDSEKLVSRLETEPGIQGHLFGYPNYIYMLIMTLSGEGQVNLVGYHDD